MRGVHDIDVVALRESATELRVVAHGEAHPDSLRRSVLRSTAAFFKLAHPDIPNAAVLAQALRLARAHPPLPGDDSGVSDEELCARVLDTPHRSVANRYTAAHV